MILEIAVVITVGLLWAAIGVIFSRIARDGVPFAPFMAATSLLTSLLAWLLFPRFRVLAEQGLFHEPRLWLLIVPAGILGALGMTMMNLAMRSGHHGASWVIGQSALAFPFLLGILLWHDRVQAVNGWGFLAVIGCIVSLGLGGRARVAEPKSASLAGAWLPAAILSLLFLGTQQTLTTVPSRWPDWRDLSGLRVPLLMTGSALGYTLLNLRSRRPLRPIRWRMTLLFSAIAVTSQFLLFLALDLFAGTSRTALVYPVAVGTCTFSFSLYSVLVMKEKGSSWHLLGMGLGCVGVVLMSLR